MILRLATYLLLEKIQKQARETGDVEFSNIINDNIQPFWDAIGESLWKKLKSPTTRDDWSVQWSIDINK